MNTKTVWKLITVAELVVAAAVVLLDLFVPTLVILGMVSVSLLVRREPMRWLGLKRPPSWLRMAGFAYGSAFLLQLFDIGVVMPILNRLTGTSVGTHPGTWLLQFHRRDRFLLHGADLRPVVRSYVIQTEDYGTSSRLRQGNLIPSDSG